MTNTTTTTNTIAVNEGMKMKDLRAIGKEFGVKAPVGTTKKELVEAIEAAQKQIKTEEMVEMTAKTIVTKEVVANTVEIKEEVVMSKEEKAFAELAVVKDPGLAKALARTEIGDVTAANPAHFSTMRLHPVQDTMMKYLEDGARKFMDHQEEFEVEVTDYMFVQRPLNYFDKKVVGVIQVQVPANTMVIKQWDRNERKFNDVPVETIAFTQAAPQGNTVKMFKVNPFATAPAGQGILTLPIIEGKDGLVTVKLPMTRAEKDGKVSFYPVFKSRRNNTDFFTDKTNEAIDGLLTAAARLLRTEWVKANPQNRGGINESCKNCAFVKYFPIKDGVTDDLETDKGTLEDITKGIQTGRVSQDFSSARWIQQQSIDELANNGQFIPQHYCPIMESYVSKEATFEFNKLSQADANHVEQEDGSYVYVPAGKAYVSGRAMDYNEYLDNELENIASSCSHYHMNEQKDDHMVANETVDAREEAGRNADGSFKYVSVDRYFRTRSQAGRLLVQTKVGNTWVNSFPGELDANTKVNGLRVYGLQGYRMNLSNKALIQFAQNEGLDYVPAMEERDADKFLFNTILRGSYATLFNNNATEKDIKEVEAYVLETPAHISAMFANHPEGARLEEKWNKMVAFYNRKLGWRNNQTRKDFKVKFFGQVAEGRRVFGEDAGDFSPAALLYDFKWNQENENVLHTSGGTLIDYTGGSITINENGEEKELVYGGVTASEFVRSVDAEKAQQLIEYVLTTGREVAFEADVNANITEGDVELLAGALQILLQRELNRYVWAVRQEQEADRREKMSFLSDEAKVYINDNL